VNKTPKLSRAELLRRINSFPYWHYSFDLGDGIVINPGDDGVQGSREFVWPAVLQLCGGTLDGLRVLDVACNAGFWCLQAVNSGAAHVLGVDARSLHIDQAELVRDAYGIDPDRLEYRVLNIYDLSPESVGVFDLCLAFRVLHHLRHPMLALDRLRAVCRALLVVDVRLTQDEGCVLKIHGEDTSESLYGVDGLALRPSKTAIEQMLLSSGFDDVRFVPPDPPERGEYGKNHRAVLTARVKDAIRQR
jgi:tRNA (mo5U34)-methyltransferase